MPVIVAYIMGPYLDGPADRVSDKTERSECRYEKSWLANQPRSCSSPIYQEKKESCKVPSFSDLMGRQTDGQA